MSCHLGRLTRTQKQSFIEHGFLAIPQVVPQALVHRALRGINHSLGQGRDASDLVKLSQQSWCPELGNQATITDLFNQTPTFQLAEDLIGAGKVMSVGSGQVPPRFPQALEVDEAKPPQGHIDGIGSGNNGIEQGVYRRFFTAVCVVLLSDLPAGWMGNFTVWPGSHHRVSEHLSRHGHQVLSQGSPQIDWDIQPEMCTGKAGDVIFAHYLTFHSASMNLSPFIRYAAIFRVRHQDAETNGVAGYTDLWREYEGLHDLLDYQKPALAG